MSGTSKTARQERAAALRVAQAQAERRRRVLLASGVIGLVLLVVVALVIAKAAGLGSGGSTASPPDSGGTGAGVIKAVTNVPAATLDKVGVGTAQAAPSRIQAPALNDNGKPKVLYVGAEYCPFCAAERWAVVVALSRFGTWSGLGATTSASNDVYPNTPTLSFHGATYTSDYLSFTGVETQTNKLVNGSYEPLDPLSAADQKTFDTYNRPPYTAGSAGGIPFVDIAGRYVTSGASYSPEVLAGKSRAQIAAALAKSGTPIAQAVDGSANVLTAALCDATGGKPAPVCTAPGVMAAASALAKAQSK
jgi:hypothetical protein